MAVEARHHSLFAPQLLGSREMMNPVGGINPNIYSNNAQMGYCLPLSATASTTETLLPVYNSLIADSVPQKTSIKSESGLSHNHLLMSRKRPRESLNPILSYPTLRPKQTASPFSFLGQDMSLQIHQQQLDVDHLISQHMEKVKMELEDKRNGQARRLLEAIEEGMLRRLKAKEEEIEKIGKLNWALAEKVKSLCMENQIWRDMAQTNEATANALRTNLEQVLAAKIKKERAGIHESAARAGEEMDDAESCCGSSDEGERETRLSEDAADSGNSSGRICRNCRKEESCVLLLPCRHLCLCTVCGSSINTCPICKTTKNASFHVNMA